MRCSQALGAVPRVKTQRPPSWVCADEGSSHAGGRWDIMAAGKVALGTRTVFVDTGPLGRAALGAADVLDTAGRQGVPPPAALPVGRTIRPARRLLPQRG